MENLLFSPIPLIDFKEVIREVIREELSFTQQNNQIDKLLSGAEACELFEPKICKATLINWAKKGRLIQHRMGRRVFYKHSEIIDSLKIYKKYIH